jgi:hypothetical protein
MPLDDRHYSSDDMDCDEEVLVDVEDSAPIDEKGVLSWKGRRVIVE